MGCSEGSLHHKPLSFSLYITQPTPLSLSVFGFDQHWACRCTESKKRVAFKNFCEEKKLEGEEKAEVPVLPKYQDWVKERRENQNPDYEPTELGSFHAVAPLGTVYLRSDTSQLSLPSTIFVFGIYVAFMTM
ncbi:uncharacterized protein LOC130771255 [Actinidia eriantha]|uniref:uncharacterized protein LOC130771255 n=1 Tax=Actinidia eriantha TaxID=165200 RepID=UPI00258539FB|nr:uncharacterized protein LOC130771255 [Actinidia eriantha]